jgi:hypothetical protein
MMVNRGGAAVVAAVLILAGLPGCGTPTQPVTPTPAPTTVPPLTLAPAPSPTPAPTPTPCTQGLCEPPVENSAPPVRVTMRLYTIEDGSGEFITKPDPTQPIPVGFWARLDVTAKERTTWRPTATATSVFFSNIRSIQVSGGHTNQRRVKAIEPVIVECWAVLDEVRSNTLTLEFK